MRDKRSSHSSDRVSRRVSQPLAYFPGSVDMSLCGPQIARVPETSPASPDPAHFRSASFRLRLVTEATQDHHPAATSTADGTSSPARRQASGGDHHPPHNISSSWDNLGRHRRDVMGRGRQLIARAGVFRGSGGETRARNQRISPDHSRDVWLVGVDGWFGLWCGVGWLIGVCRGSGGAGGLVRGAWGRGCSTAGVRDWSGAPVR